MGGALRRLAYLFLSFPSLALNRNDLYRVIVLQAPRAATAVRRIRSLARM